MEGYSSAITRLDIPLLPDETTATVASTLRMPASALFKIRINSEVMLVTGIDNVTSTITVERHDPAPPAFHPAGSAVMTDVAALVFDDAVPGALSNLKIARANAGPVDNTKTGATNLGFDTEAGTPGAALGAAADYATVLGGDRCNVEGTYGIAAGYQTNAQGPASAAFGNSTVARGANAFATGQSCQAQGDNSIAGGINATASNEGAVAFNSIASGVRSFAAGSANLASGDYAQCFGTISKATQHTAVAFGLQTECHGIHGFTWGEDTRVGEEAFDPAEGPSGESAMAGNHFNRALGRASTVLGCNSKTEKSSQRSFVHGFAARGFVNTQHAFACGGFSRWSGEEALEHAEFSGEAQTSRLVHRATTPGGGIGETAELVYDGSPQSGLPLEDGKAYAITLTALATGTLDGVAGRATRMITRRALYTCSGGAAVKIAEDLIGALPYPDLGTALGNEATWDITFGATGNIALFTFTTGESRARCHLVCKTEYQEVVFEDFED